LLIFFSFLFFFYLFKLTIIGKELAHENFGHLAVLLCVEGQELKKSQLVHICVLVTGMTTTEGAEA